MISIATSYKNRRSQFIRTLKSIQKSSIKDVEVIVVDDASDQEHRLEDLVEQFPFLKIIRVELEDKWYNNPCIAFNKAFAAAVGDKVIIQNPECLHIGDVLQYVQDNLTDENYLSFAAFSLTELLTRKLDEVDFLDWPMIQQGLAQKGRAVTCEGDEGWYNHSKYRPTGYHFCSAITRNNLNKLGGFDERFAGGQCYDDDEFLYRIRTRLKASVTIVDTPCVLHQWHYTTNIYHQSNSTELVAANRALFETIKREIVLNPNDGWKFNVPKILHVYWDKSPLSYLQMLTVVTFNHYNPDWQIIIHVPKQRFSGNITWRTGEQIVKYYGQDFTEQMLALPYVTVQEFDFEAIGVKNDIPEVFKSDFLRWHLLGTMGGCWSDMDILYTGPMKNITPDGCMMCGEGHKVDTSLCIREDRDAFAADGKVLVHIVGFHLASANNSLFKAIAEISKKTFSADNYQSVGSHLLRAALPTQATIQKVFPDINVINLPSEIVYPFSDKQISLMFETTNHNLIASRTIGVHWFNGSHIAKLYTNEFTLDFDKLRPCTITDLVKQFHETQ